MNIYIIATVVLVAGISIWLWYDVRRKKPVKKERTADFYRFENITEELRNAVNAVLNEDISTMNILPEQMVKRRKQQMALRNATRTACLGDPGEGEYLKEYLKELLQTRLGINEQTICLAIPFGESAHMSAQELFEYMYMMYRRIYGIHVFRHMEEDFGFTEPEYDEEGRPIFSITEGKVRAAYNECKYVGTYVDMLETLTQRCYELLYGHDVADLLIMDGDFDGVSGGVGGRTRNEYNYMEELMGLGDRSADNSFDVVYAVYKGRLVRMKFMSFGREEALIRVVKNIYRYNTRATLSKRNPVLNASLRNNSRIVVARPPVSDSWAFYVRKFASTDARKIESLIVDEGAEKVIELLKQIVTSEMNFTISGNTGGGKTTLLKALVSYINPSYALRVIESSFELNINNLYPDRNVHVMQERGDYTVYDCIAASKKMDTDVLILGEVNEPKIAGAFVQVAQSGSRMAITTLHHETTRKLIDYLRNALVECGLTDVRIAERQVVELINFDVHMVHDVSGHHYIERITQILPCDEDSATMQRTYTLRNIVEFDTERKKYVFLNEPVGLTVKKGGEAAG